MAVGRRAAIEVRPCEERDVAPLAAAEPEGADIAVRLFARQQRGESIYLLARIDGEVVGHGELLLGDDPELRSLHVQEEHRGQGVGAALISAAEKVDGLTTLALGVGRDNHGARRLYERLGYVGTGKLTTTTYTYVDADGPHEVTETDERLVKQLRPATMG